MSILVAGNNYTFNFGSMDFSQGITINTINIIVSGSNTDMLSGFTPKPIVHTKEQFLELLVFMKISTSFVLSDIGTFTGNTDLIFQQTALQVTYKTVSYNIICDGSVLPQ